MKSQRVLVPTLVAVVAFLSGGWLLQRGSPGGQNVYQKARLFDDVLTYVAEYYVDSLNEGQLYDMAIDGMLRQLNDPYTTYLRERDLRDLELSTTGNYAGVGMQIDVRDGWITVIAPIAGTPAEALGIQTGDRIVEINGESTRGWDNERAVRELRGPPGTKVKLTIVRPGVPDPLRFEPTRARIHVTSMQYAGALGGGEVAYVSFVNSSISETTAAELSKAVDSLRQRGAKSLIVDLRGNPGGVLDQGVAVSDLFLARGDVVAETRGRAPGASQKFRAERPERWPGMPVVVLVDGGTASAAEIIAGALQDHDRALVLGTPTFGKGLVQTVYNLNGREALKLTTGRWFTPSGRTIQRTTGRQFDPLALRAQESPEAAEEPGQPPDSAASDTLQVFRTAGGRTVYGGGGIRPDVTVRADTLTDGEKEFARALGGNTPAYRDVLTSYALELKGQNLINSPSFEVTAAMRGELLRRLRARGARLSEAQWEGAAGLVAEQLEFEITRYVFGRPAEFARRVSEDVQVKRAVELVTKARTPKELLALAQRPAQD
ncbi:MAG: S41 family peptidase [Gemmatimonadetes bacterium]|nr:S41 family peptidase [Gemmatimonadota bacterium]MBI2538023.1 S41 family peptidase [Gemmatimonadota bacterium]